MTLKIIHADELEIATESFGDPSDPAILLIMGGMASMLWWPETFCRRLAGHGRFIIRYDQRDSGLSTSYPAGEPGYDFDGFVDDVFRILDGYGISAAHLAGFSLGGMVAQGAALKKPERVLSLTALSTSPLGIDTSGFPPCGAEWMAHMGKEVDWENRTEAVAYLVEDSRLVASTVHAFDEEATTRFIEADFDRSGGYLSATNHSVLFQTGKTWLGSLQRMNAPLLVIHGTSDPVFPPRHGEALADTVAGARLLKIEGGGHELHPGDWPEIIAAIAEHSNH